MESDVFCKIVKREIPATIYFEDEDVMAIKNINPEASFHALIIPKEHLELSKTGREKKELLGQLLLVANQVAVQEGLENGYRLIINNGPDSGQEINHLHVHLLGGERLGRMVCN